MRTISGASVAASTSVVPWSSAPWRRSPLTTIGAGAVMAPLDQPETRWSASMGHAALRAVSWRSALRNVSGLIPSNLKFRQQLRNLGRASAPELGRKTSLRSSSASRRLPSAACCFQRAMADALRA